MSVIRFRLITLILVFAAIVLSACQPAVDGPGIAVSGVWARSSSSKVGAVYATIKNRGNESDRLIGVSTTAAKTVEIHESIMDNGVMSMRPVENGLEIPAGEKVELKPGGAHIMLIDLTQFLVPGTKVILTFQFEKSGEIVLDAEIRAQ
jgi:copper(I)-binding protein